MRQIFAIIQHDFNHPEANNKDCPAGSIVEIILVDKAFDLDSFINAPANHNINVIYDNDSFQVKKYNLKDYWIV